MFHFLNPILKRIEFIDKKKFLFKEISNFINNCIDQSKNIFIFCAGNSIISKDIKSKKFILRKYLKNIK